MPRKSAFITAGAIVVAAVIAGGALLIRHPGTATPASGRAAARAASAVRRAPVVTCPTIWGLEGKPPSRYPTAESVLASSAQASQLAYYSDQARSVQPILGPRGWECSVTVAADGGVAINVYPPGKSPTGPEAVNAHNDSACEGCMYADVCPIIPHAAAQFRYMSVPCPSLRPPGQNITWISGSPVLSADGNDVIAFTDPPGVRGYGGPSGGPYATTGMLLYSWHTNANSSVSVLNCALPAEDRDLCAVILRTFRQQQWTGR